MKKPIAILFTLFLLTASFGQNNEDSHQLWVINILGAKVYEKPTFNSKTLALLPVGKTVVIEKSVNSQEILKIGNGFFLKGNWIKPKEINGFIFSSDFTDRKAEIGKNQFGHNSINILGSLKQTKGNFLSILNTNFMKMGSTPILHGMDVLTTLQSIKIFL